MTMCGGRRCTGPGGCVTRMLMESHAVDAPMAARTPGGAAGARLQGSSLALSVRIAGRSDPVFNRRGEPANYAYADFPAAPWRVVGPVHPDMVNLDNRDAPTRTDALNALMRGV